MGPQMAYGKLYSGPAYTGLLYCYDLTDGKLLWTYGNGGPGNTTHSGFAVPGNYPTVVTAIGDGIIYTSTSEHQVETPIYKGALLRAINATTGEELWTLSNDNNGAYLSWAMADGYATTFNGYDNQIYCVGRGPSKITVSAPDISVQPGTSIIIKGTVTDVAAGTEHTEQKGKFANGVPCVSDESQGEWMEYVYMQQPKPTDVTGVTVELFVLDANNNYRSIGTTTTDTNGFYSYQWLPDITGKFTVYAQFAGSKAYWPSQATTAFAVDAVEATPAPTETPPSAVEQYFLPAVAGLFVLGIILLVLLIMVLLKKKE